MDSQLLLTMGIAVGLLTLSMLAIPLLYARLYHKIDQGQVLIVNKVAQIEVFFTGGLVIPTVHRAEVMDISVKTLKIKRTGKEGVICKDNIRADIAVTFFIRVNPTTEDVIQVARALGAARASDPEALQELFEARFADAIKAVVKTLDFEQLYAQRDELREAILTHIGEDLAGFVLEDLVIDALEQTPLHHLDPNNILDAEGIKKITEITAARALETETLRREEERALRVASTEAKELLIEHERRVGSALAQLRADTGKTLTAEQLEDRLLERLRELVDRVVTERLRQ